MAEPAFTTARTIAARVQPHFAEHLAAARARGRTDVASEPDSVAIESLIDTAFWASLRREEGLTPKISLAWVPIERAGQALTFETPLPFTASMLARVAPAVERRGIHLGVWHYDDGLGVWGTTRTLPPYCFVIEVITSGLLVIKHRSEQFGKFVNVAVVEADQIKIVDERSVGSPECPDLIASLLGVSHHRPGGAQRAPGAGAESFNVLVQMAASMRAHGRGGTLLVVPAASTAWSDSILNPVLYAVDPPFTELSDVMARHPLDGASHEWEEDFRRAVDALAGLTAVDGATIVSDRYELLAFGAKITRRRGNPTVERVQVSEPIEGGSIVSATPYQLGGTRHFSAAQFVHDQRDAMALVASQDGRFTVFKWSPRQDAVHAHRIEALLL
jgi:hypothetical protein